MGRRVCVCGAQRGSRFASAHGGGGLGGLGDAGGGGVGGGYEMPDAVSEPSSFIGVSTLLRSCSGLQLCASSSNSAQ
jgi:hypothetical protein